MAKAHGLVSSEMSACTDKATFGHTWRVVLPENEDALAAIGWQPLSAEMGYQAGDNTVTIARYTGGGALSSVSGSTPEELLPYLADTLQKLSDDKVKIRIIHSGVGAVSESDVLLGTASKAIIIAFNVRPDRNAESVASREGVDIRQHSIIYNVTDEMKKAMVGLLEPTFKEVRIGVAEVRDIFKVPKFGTIAGCMVTEGRITRSGDAQARLLRDNVVVFEGKIGSLRRFKDDVSEVKAGFECGIGIENFNDLKEGDIIEAFEVREVARQL